MVLNIYCIFQKYNYILPPITNADKHVCVFEDLKIIGEGNNFYLTLTYFIG